MKQPALPESEVRAILAANGVDQTKVAVVAIRGYYLDSMGRPGENDRMIGAISDRDIAVRGVAQGLDGSATVREVMRRLGHTQPTVAMIYQVADAQRDAAVARHRRRQLARVDAHRCVAIDQIIDQIESIKSN